MERFHYNPSGCIQGFQGVNISIAHLSQQNGDQRTPDADPR